MKVSELLAERHQNWAELQQLCGRLEGRRARRQRPETLNRFAALYRAACADLALADAYQLPPNTVQYLHHLVAQAHSQLYPSRSFRLRSWPQELLYNVPRRLFFDKTVWWSFALFFGFFVGAYFLAKYDPQFAKETIGEENMEAMRTMYRQPVSGRNFRDSNSMMGFYIQHNATIGLRCFAYGLVLFGIGGLFEMSFNAIFLGAVFGYISTTPQRENFFTFVTAHGPFELTAIALSAAAGMRLGSSVVWNGDLTRLASLRRAGREAMPTVSAAVILFIFAAVIEGFVSPSAAPYGFKLGVGALSCCVLLFYFVMLGMPPLSPIQPRRDGSWEDAVKD